MKDWHLSQISSLVKYCQNQTINTQPCIVSKRFPVSIFSLTLWGHHHSLNPLYFVSTRSRRHTKMAPISSLSLSMVRTDTACWPICYRVTIATSPPCQHAHIESSVKCAPGLYTSSICIIFNIHLSSQKAKLANKKNQLWKNI